MGWDPGIQGEANQNAGFVLCFSSKLSDNIECATFKENIDLRKQYSAALIFFTFFLAFQQNKNSLHISLV